MRRPGNVEHQSVSKIEVLRGVCEDHRWVFVFDGDKQFFVASQLKRNARDEHLPDAVAVEERRKRHHMIGIGMREYQEIDGPVEERHLLPHFFQRRQIRSSINDNLFPGRRNQKSTVTLADIQKMDVEMTVRLQPPLTKE